MRPSWFPIFYHFIVFANGQLAQQEPLTTSHDVSYQNSFDTIREDFDDRVASLLDHFHLPSISIAVVEGNSTYAKGYGHAILPSKPATPHSLYYVGSTTKSFTAASVLKLVEASVNDSTPLTLKTKVADLIRADFLLSDPYATNHVTLEDALSHRTGLPRHDASYRGTNETLSSFLHALRYLPFTAELREKWQYNNMMFVAVSHVIETLTESRLGTFMREHIWAPLGMTSTCFGLQEARTSPDLLARGYRWNNASQQYSTLDYVDQAVISGAGNIISNVADYAKYLRAMITKDPAILSESSYDELRTPRAFSTPGWGTDLEVWTGPEMYSLGWQVAVYHGYEIFSHGGSIDGFGAQMAYLPSLKGGVGFVAFANTDGTSNWVELALMFDVLDEMIGVPKDERVAWVEIFDRIVKEVKEGTTPEAARKRLYPVAPPADQALPLPLPLEAYAGKYWNNGYHGITVKCVNLLDLPWQPHGQLKAEKVLYVEVRDKIWTHDIIFEHITGDYFIAWMNHHTNELLGRQSVIAKFELDVSSKVAALGIEYEPDMGRKNLIWFTKAR